MINFTEKELTTLKMAGWDGNGGTAGAFNFWLSKNNQSIKSDKPECTIGGTDSDDVRDSKLNNNNTENTEIMAKNNMTVPNWITEKLLAAGVKEAPKAVKAPTAKAGAAGGIQVSDEIAEQIFGIMFDQWFASDDAKDLTELLEADEITAEEFMQEVFRAGVTANRG